MSGRFFITASLILLTSTCGARPELYAGAASSSSGSGQGGHAPAGVTATGSGGAAPVAGSGGVAVVGSGGSVPVAGSGGVAVVGSGGAATALASVSSSSAASSTGAGGALGGDCAASVVPTSDGNPFATVLADLDGDGAVDLVVPENGPCGVEVFLGDGKGGFGPGAVVQVGPADGSCACGGVGVADLDGDGAPDLVALDYIGEQVSVLLGKGDGTFGAPVRYPAPPAPAAWGIAIAVADVDGDGKPDVVTGGLDLLRGNGDGTLQPAQPIVAGITCSGGGCVVEVGDVDGDGLADLVINGTGDVTVLRGAGGGAFHAPQGSGANLFPSSIALGDLDGDGRLDVALAEIQGPDVQVMLGNGDGTFGAPSLVLAVPGPITAGSTGDVAVHDVDGDGRLDLVFTFGTILYVYLGDGHGHFAPSPLTQASPLTPSQVGWVGPISIAPAASAPGSPVLYATADGGGSAVTVYAGACY